jgi:hypothetical protein
MGEKNKVTPLRDWTEQSYGNENGRAVSSLEGSGNMGNKAMGKGRQIPSFEHGKASGYSRGGPDGTNKRGGSRVP